MKILYSYKDESEREYAASKLSEDEIIFHKGSLEQGEWDGAGVTCACIFVDSTVGKDTLAKLPDLKFIATRSTGFDHIDMALAKERGITVSSVPAYGEHTVAEYVFALLLTLSRNMKASLEAVRQGSFSSDGLSGFDLFGKTIGIAGTGRIGKNTAMIAQGFGMKVVAFDAYPDEKFAAEKNIRYMSLEELLGAADIISLHLPESKETHHIIDAGMVAKMKRGMIVVNTARGSLIDTGALVKGLQDETIAGAALDVLDEEGYVADELRLLDHPHPHAEQLKTLLWNHYLIDHPHVVITPHNAFNTHEALQRILDTTIDNIKSFAADTPQNVVK